MIITESQQAASECKQELVIDVRSPAEFREVHIPGSINLPLGDVKAWGATLKDRCSHVTVVCQSGQRAQRACESLAGLGFETATVLSGGIADWMAAGKEVNRGRGGVSLERQVRMLAGVLILAGTLLGAFVHGAFYGLAGVMGAGLFFSGATDSCAMGMLLAKLPYNRAKGGCPV